MHASLQARVKLSNGAGTALWDRIFGSTNTAEEEEEEMVVTPGKSEFSGQQPSEENEAATNRQFQPIMDPENVDIRKRFARDGILRNRRLSSLTIIEQPPPSRASTQRHQREEMERILNTPNLSIPVATTEEYMHLAQ